MSPEDKNLEELKNSDPQLVFSFSTPVVATAMPPPTRTAAAAKVKLDIKVIGAGATRMLALVALPEFDQR